MTWLQRTFTPLKHVLPRAAWQPIRAIATGLITPVRFSVTTGHWKSSISATACASDGTPLPWYTYPAIDFLSQRNLADKNILEFGGGQSTLWWSARASSVLTIEEDLDWSERLRSKISDNVELHHVLVDHATRSVASIKSILDARVVRKFDVIIVDGHLRRELTALAFQYLSQDGAIILDNSEGYGFFEETRNRGCRRIDFFGFAPGVSLRHCTSIVFVGDCFLLRSDIPIPSLELVGPDG